MAYHRTAFLVDGQRVELTTKERRLFVELYNARGKLVSYRALTHFVTGQRHELSQLVNRLRPKLRTTRFRIYTELGLGYRMKRKDK